MFSVVIGCAITDHLTVQLMRMTATAVVRAFVETLLFVFMLRLDYGATWHVCACSSGEVGQILTLDRYPRILIGHRLSPVDAIITRMGAYDNMFSHASTFKVELDEW